MTIGAARPVRAARYAVRTMMLRTSIFLVLSSIAGLAAAGDNGCDDLRGRPIQFDVDWQTEVKPIINNSLGGFCTTCHGVGGSGGLDLSDEFVDAIYKIVNNVVIPGDPIGSRLFDKVNCAIPHAGGSRMPLAGDPLTLEQQELIFDWIDQGALGENPEKPISRDFISRIGNESLRY